MRVRLGCLVASLAIVGGVAVAPAASSAPATAYTVADRHEAHGHDQWRSGAGTSGHTWTAYRREARQINAYVLAVALSKLARCASEPHCAVRLASFFTHAPHGLVAAVVGCESGWNPSASNPSSSAGGLFQFLDSTWRSMAPGWGMGGRSRYEVWPAAVVGSGAIAQGGIGHWEASRGCWG